MTARTWFSKTALTCYLIVITAGLSYGQNITALLAQLLNSDPAIRSVAFYKIIAAPSSANIAAVTGALITLLGVETAYAKSLTEADEGYATYYENVAIAVASLHDVRAMTPLLDVIDTGNTVTEALAAFGPAAIDGVVNKLTDSDPEIRDSATIVLSQMLDPPNIANVSDPVSLQKITAGLLTASQDVDVEVRSTASEGLVKLSGGQVAVPNVVGLTQAAASSAITGAGLVVGTVTTASSATVPSGGVVSENPAAGTQVSAGSAVNLVVSNGPAPVAVPNVVGLTQAAASSAITGAGLVVGTVTTASSATVPSGSVISENPAAGTQVNRGSAVNLVVSSGPAVVGVPNVVGLTQAAAAAAIQSAGLVVGTVTPTSSGTVPAGNVISENPVAGSQVVIGSAVNLVVSSGPAPAPIVLSFNVLFGAQSYNVTTGTRNRLPWEIVGVRVVFSEAITTGSAASLSGLAVTGFSGLGTNTLTWSISPVALGSLNAALSGTGANALTDAGGNGLYGGAGFTQALRILSGDFNDDGVVSAADLVGVNNATVAPYNIFADMNGDLAVTVADVQVVRTRIGTSLP